MALVWERRENGSHYSLRRAGRSLRLYRDGIFHSQYNPGRPLSGGIWDLLVLPALFMAEPPRRTLMLGVGGGAVIRQLADLLPACPERYTVGVELDPVHLHIAREFFSLKEGPGLRLVAEDAVDWLHRYRGAPFDLIIDDLFAGRGSHPRRAVAVDAAWLNTLESLLSGSGALAINFESRAALRGSALMERRAAFAAAYSLSVPGYDNRIAVGFRGRASREQLRGNLSQLRARRGAAVTRPLRARVRRL